MIINKVKNIIPIENITSETINDLNDRGLNMNARTPTPITNIDGIIYDANDVIIAKCNTFTNARNIVHCVNVHDELINSLELMYGIVLGMDNTDYAERIKVAKQTLSKSKGE